MMKSKLLRLATLAICMVSIAVVTTAGPANAQGGSPQFPDCDTSSFNIYHEWLRPNDKLCPGDIAESPNAYNPDGTSYFDWLVYQASDGNLVLYQTNYNVNGWLSSTVPLWASNTGRDGIGAAVMQGSDGNFVVYDGNWRAPWAAGAPYAPGAALKVQTDGKICIYGPPPGYQWKWCNI